MLPSRALDSFTGPFSFPRQSVLGNFRPLFLPCAVGVSAAPAAAATAAVVAEPEEAFSSRAPAAGAAGTWHRKGPLVLRGRDASLLNLFDGKHDSNAAFPRAVQGVGFSRVRFPLRLLASSWLEW